MAEQLLIVKDLISRSIVVLNSVISQYLYMYYVYILYDTLVLSGKYRHGTECVECEVYIYLCN